MLTNATVQTNEMQLLLAQQLIVVADASPDIANVIQEAFLDKATVIHMQDGKQAAAYLKQNPATLVIAEEELPKLSGKHIINGMRHIRHLKDVPAILLSQYPKQSFKDATHILAWPQQTEELTHLVQQTLASSSITKLTTKENRTTKHIFIAESNKTIRELLKLILGNEGFDITLVTSEQEAMDKLSNNLADYDLAILDVNLPNNAGFKLLEYIDVQGEIPCLILSAFQEGETVEKSMAMGAKDIIPKPFNPRELIVRINTHLSAD